MDNSTGRPRIGPKVQTNVPDEAKEYIEARAERFRVDEAVVVRELILMGIDSAKLAA